MIPNIHYFCSRTGWLLILGLALLGGPGALSATEDQVVFENHCASCHGNDGRGKTPQGRKIKARDLRESRLTDEEIERQIREGSRNKTGATVMPAFGRELKEAEIQAAVRVVKAFRAPTPTDGK